MPERYIKLPPGMEIEFLHRLCPRCGLDLTQQLPDTEGDEGDAEQIKRDAYDACRSRISPASDAAIEAHLQRMVEPLTEAEKERAQRYEQRWLEGQIGQKTGASEKKNGEASSHQHLVPMVESKLCKWIIHAWKFITGRR